jgi:hypothetical protein
MPLCGYSAMVELNQFDSAIIDFGRGEDFDEQSLPGLNSEALHFRAASESYSPVRTLANLVDRGLVREIGTGPQDPRRRYFLAERGPA